MSAVVGLVPPVPVDPRRAFGVVLARNLALAAARGVARDVAVHVGIVTPPVGPVFEDNAHAVDVADVRPENEARFVAHGTQVAEILVGQNLDRTVAVLVAVRQVAVRAVGRIDLVVVVLQETVLGQQRRKTVFEIFGQPVEIRFRDVPQLVTADVTVGFVVAGGVVLPLETREQFVDDDAREFARPVGQAAAVAAVETRGIGVEIDVLTLDVAHERRAFLRTVGARGVGIPLVDRGQRAFADRQFAVGERDIGVNVIVGQLPDALLLARNVGRRAQLRADDHGRLHALERETVRIGVVHQPHALQRELDAAVTHEDVVVGRLGLDHESQAAVYALDVGGLLANLVVDRRLGGHGVGAHVAACGIADHPRRDVIVVFDGHDLPGTAQRTNLFERPLRAEIVAGIGLHDVESGGGDLVPAVGERKGYLRRTHILLVGVGLRGEKKRPRPIVDTHVGNPARSALAEIDDLRREAFRSDVCVERDRNGLFGGAALHRNIRRGKHEPLLDQPLLADVDRVAAAAAVVLQQQARHAGEGVVGPVGDAEGAVAGNPPGVGLGPGSLLEERDVAAAVAVHLDLDRTALRRHDVFAFHGAEFDDRDLVRIVGAGCRTAREGRQQQQFPAIFHFHGVFVLKGFVNPAGGLRCRRRNSSSSWPPCRSSRRS